MGFTGWIYHGWGDAERGLKKLDPTHAVMPTRSAVYREMGCQKRGAVPPTEDADTWNIMRAVIHWRLPFKAVSYEAFIEDPEGHVRWFRNWFGSGKTDVDTEWIVNGNEKYYGSTSRTRSMENVGAIDA